MQGGTPDETTTLGLDVVVPVYNEAACLPELVRRLGAVRARLHDDGVDLHVILVDDGSRDDTPALVEELATKYHWVRPIHLARNFGHQAAMTAGLDASSRDYVCVIDADLQDPPELIPDMLEVLRTKGVDVAYGLREHRVGESRFKLRTANAFYRLLRRASGIDIPVDTGDFRIMRRRVVDALRGLPEHNRFVRALVPWLGYEAIGFPYRREQRYAGETKYPFRKMLSLAAHAITAFSTVPIRLVQALGFALLTVGAVATGSVLTLSLLGIVTPGVLAWLVVGLVVHTGLVLLAIGVVGGYVFRIQDEVKGRPLYVRADVAPDERARSQHPPPDTTTTWLAT